MGFEFLMGVTLIALGFCGVGFCKGKVRIIGYCFCVALRMCLVFHTTVLFL